jgi:hypothetical protein
VRYATKLPFYISELPKNRGIEAICSEKRRKEREEIKGRIEQ